MTLNGYASPPPFLILLFAMAVAWLVLVAVLRHRISTRHPDLFDRMDRPGMFLGQDGKPSYALVKFMVLRQHRRLGDRALSVLSDGMVLYYAAFAAGFVLFWIDAAQA